MKKIIVYLIIATWGLAAKAQNLKQKQAHLSRLTAVPTIDGVLGDEAWENATVLKDFIQYQPANGPAEKPGFETKIYIGYDDFALYIGAMMYDPRPDLILTQLTQRDDYSGNADWVGFYINPFNDGLHDFNFWLTAAGVQVDSRTTAEGDDRGWNTVWKSAVQITENGWVAELKIPYRCLRFPEANESAWAFNAQRSIRRNREEYTWSFVDINIDNFKVQAGLLSGVNNIDSPIRLSIMPNLTSTITSYKGDVENTSFNVGADIKYGLTEAFTLDMTLLPDFSQVAFDNQVLNLTPFENRFDENRQFFTEGVELFNRADLFYSRRIGGVPKNITGNNANELDDLSLNFTRMLNASKVSGRTSKNLGIGVLNAITANNFTTGTDPVTGESVSILTEPLTNYNVIALDQRFWRNSSLSFINTHVLRDGPFRDANVASGFLTLSDRGNKYRLNYQFSHSDVFDKGSYKSGFKSVAGITKQSGKIRFKLNQWIETDTYDQTDLGFQPRNNRFNHSGEISYQNIQPEWVFNRYRFTLSANHHQLYEPRSFERSDIGFSFFGLFKTFDAIGYNNEIRPGQMYDFFEPRFKGMYNIRPSSFWQEFWISSDYRKPVALDAQINNFFLSNYGTKGWGLSLSPRIRLSDHIMIFADFIPNFLERDFGWVSNPSLSADSIVYGVRNIKQFTSNVRGSYVFNPDMSFSLNFRHYWSKVDYKEYWLLRTDGEFDDFPDYKTNHDINFNTLNLDLRFSWWFLPGSELVFLYRTTLSTTNQNITDDYFYNLNQSLNTPSRHNVSLRVVFFIDYIDVARKKARPGDNFSNDFKPTYHTHQGFTTSVGV